MCVWVRTQVGDRAVGTKATGQGTALNPWFKVGSPQLQFRLVTFSGDRWDLVIFPLGLQGAKV